MNNGRLEEILLPNSQYFLDTENNDLAAVDKTTGKFLTYPLHFIMKSFYLRRGNCFIRRSYKCIPS